MFFGYLQVPTAAQQAASTDPLSVTCQVLTSWPYKSGFLDRSEPSEVPTGDVERLAWMKKISSTWIEPFREIVQGIPDDRNLHVQAISLEDWPPQKGAWDNHGGTVTLIGDAAHAMTMCRFYYSLFVFSGDTC